MALATTEAANFSFPSGQQYDRRAALECPWHWPHLKKGVGASAPMCPQSNRGQLKATPSLEQLPAAGASKIPERNFHHASVLATTMVGATVLSVQPLLRNSPTPKSGDATWRTFCLLVAGTSGI